MPIFTYAARPGQKQMTKRPGCSRTQKAALDNLVRDHGPVVKKTETPRVDQYNPDRKLKPSATYHFEDGTQARLIGYVGMC